MPVALSRPRTVSGRIASSRVRFSLHADAPRFLHSATLSAPVSGSDDAIGSTRMRAFPAPPASAMNFSVIASPRGPPPTITRLPRGCAVAGDDGDRESCEADAEAQPRQRKTVRAKAVGRIMYRAEG